MAVYTIISILVLVIYTQSTSINITQFWKDQIKEGEV